MPRLSAPAAEHELPRPAELFAGLSPARGIVAAVSGGADSTALMVLLAGWTERPPLLVVSIDHGLRTGAADEAQMVGANAQRLGLAARIMRAPPRPSTGNLQDWARTVRYALLATAATEAGFDTIVTAHHQDDQAETFLLRLARGSGVYGLAAMAETSSFNNIRLARPLLNVKRETLAHVAAASGLATARDPGNEDIRFDRVRLRRLMPTLAEHGLTAARLSGTARRLQRAADALDHYAHACLAEKFSADGFGSVSGSAAALLAVPEEIALRALAKLCQAVGGAQYTPRLDRLETLYAAVVANAGKGEAKCTLHGVAIEIASGVLTARREWGRVGPPTLALSGGGSVLWDGRFRLAVPDDMRATHVSALGHSGRRLQSSRGGSGGLRTLPGLYRDEMLLAVPDGVDVTDEGPVPGRLAAECLVGSRLGLSSLQPVCSP